MRYFKTNNFKTILTILICIILFSINKSFAFEHPGSDSWTEYGIPLFHNYTPKEYGGHFQNWCILKDKQGIIRVANNDGLLSYDGVSWNRSDLGGELFRSLRSIAQDDSGTITAEAKKRKLMHCWKKNITENRKNYIRLAGCSIPCCRRKFRKPIDWRLLPSCALLSKSGETTTISIPGKMVISQQLLVMLPVTDLKPG
jgi:hypothetical protein